MRKCFGLNKEERLKLIEEGRKLRDIRFRLELSEGAFGSLIAKFLPPDILPNQQIISSMELGRYHDIDIYNSLRTHIVRSNPRNIEELIQCLEIFKEKGGK